MTISLKHSFQSTKVDGGDPSLVQSSNWNAEHNFTAAAGKVIGRDTSGAGSIQELPIAVDTSGNVGIGATSGGYKLDVTASGPTAVFGSASGTGLSAYTAWRRDGTILGYVGNGTGVMSGAGATDFAVGGTGARNLCLGTNDVERMRIDSSGVVLINRTGSSGLGKLNCEGGADFTAGNVYMVRDTGTVSIATTDTGGKLTVYSTTSTPAIYNRGLSDVRLSATTQASGTSYFDYFLYNGTAVGSISSTGTVTAFNTTSDARLKENVADADDAGALIDALRVRQYDWKSDGSHQRHGFIAQELDTVAPEAVTKGRTEDDMWSVDYSKLVPMLVKEVQALRARVAELEGK